MNLSKDEPLPIKLFFIIVCVIIILAMGGIKNLKPTNLTQGATNGNNTVCEYNPDSFKLFLAVFMGNNYSNSGKDYNSK